MNLLPGVTADTVATDRLSMHTLQYGPDDGVPVVLVHGNLSTGRFYEHVLEPLASQRSHGRPLRLIAPDMRGFGRTASLPIDATRGLADWSDDLHSLVQAWGITEPIHLVGWSSAGLAISQYAMDHGGVASLIYIDPVSPFGYGATRRDGSLCTPDAAGSGGGGVNPELVQRLRDGDSSADSPFSIRSVMNALYWMPEFRLPQDREDLLVDEVLMTVIGDGTYPGGAAASEHWPGFAPGVSGILNALSPVNGRWDRIVELSEKPPVLWTRGADDQIVADGSPLEMGTLGAAGVIPGWPGDDAYPPQPMVSQTADVLEKYSAAGGSVTTAVFEKSAHGPVFDAQDAWVAAVGDFLASLIDAPR